MIDHWKQKIKFFSKESQNEKDNSPTNFAHSSRCRTFHAFTLHPLEQ
jgi:hypothetical protein